MRTDLVIMKEFSYYLGPISETILSQAMAVLVKVPNCPRVTIYDLTQAFRFIQSGYLQMSQLTSAKQESPQPIRAARSRKINAVLSWEKVQSNIYSIHKLSQVLIAWHVDPFPWLSWESWQFFFLGWNGMEGRKAGARGKQMGNIYLLLKVDWAQILRVISTLGDIISMACLLKYTLLLLKNRDTYKY